MSFQGKGLTWLRRSVLYAGALGAGVALAQMTSAEPIETAPEAQPPAGPAAATAAALRPVAPVAQQDGGVLEAQPELAAVEEPVPATAEPPGLPAAADAPEPAVAPAPPSSDAAAAALNAAFKQGKIITGSTPHRLILFTFDDGPDPRTTPLLLDRLDEAGIKAVFFLVANRMGQTTPREREEALIGREIVRRGHMVGSHSLSHVALPMLDDAGVEAELRGADDVFERVFGARPGIIRVPFGSHSTRVDQIIAAHGQTIVLWNLGAGDTQVRDADEVYETFVKVFERRQRENGDRGGIVLLHDTHPWSVDAFQHIVSDLLARNCELLDRGEELFDFVDDLRFFYAPRAGAPADAEAPPAELAPDVLAQRQAVLRESTARRCKSMASAY